MDDLSSRLRYLLHAHLDGTATIAERKELMDLLKMPVYERMIKEGMDREIDLLEQERSAYSLPEERAARILSNILSAPVDADIVAHGTGREMAGYRWAWRVASIIVFIVASIGGYRWLSGNRRELAEKTKTIPSRDAAPGREKAILTLANGSTIVLDSIHSGKLTRQGGSNVVKMDSGRLAYTASGENSSDILYNSLATPRGGQYQLTLSDGTRVWLNAASSIRFPTSFTGTERRVDITGEAYFEVTKDSRMPFVVDAGGTKTTVLGTRFDINAYADEGTLRATLLEGAVLFAAGDDQRLLHPGQQAVLDDVTRSWTVREADTYQEVAWKNGQFDFDNTDLPAILRQISRWYDVDISYQAGGHDGAKFGGGISRRLNLSGVLRLLDNSGVHTVLEDKKLIVLP